MLTFVNGSGCFCIGKTMTCDLCFVPAQLYRRNFYLLKGRHNQSLTRTGHLMVSAVENYASHSDSQVKQNARTEDIHT